MSSISVAGDVSGAISIAAPSAAGSGVLTLPTGTDTLVGKATTDTLTNKTLTSPTLTSPALGTPASGVLTNCTGVAKAALPAGSVLQVVQTVVTGANTTTSATFVTTGQSATITPTRNTSKILVTVNGTNFTGPNTDAHFTVYRGATNLGGGTASSMLANHSADWGTVAINYLDSPATTSPTTYTVYFKISAGICYFNSAAVTSTITLMEIAV